MSPAMAAALQSVGVWVASMVVVVGAPLLVQRWLATRSRRRPVNRMLGRAGVLATVSTPRPRIPQQRAGE